MENYVVLLGSSAVLLSTMSLLRTARRLYLATRAERELLGELSAHHRNQVRRWTKLLATADPDSTAVRNVQKEFEKVVDKSLDEALKIQVFGALHQPSEVGRKMYLRKLLAESQSADQNETAAAAH